VRQNRISHAANGLCIVPLDFRPCDAAPSRDRYR
jgi:hypothetical protein